MITQKHRPLAIGRDFRRLAHDVGDWEAVFLRDRHIDARHQWKVVGHVAFVAIPEILLHVFRPLIGLGEQNLVGRIGIELGTQASEHGVRFRQILVVGALALAKVRDRVQTESIDPGVEPALHHLQHRPDNARIIEVQVGLVRKETMPIVGAGFMVPRPVRLLRVGEDDACPQVLLVGVAPDIPIASA